MKQLMIVLFVSIFIVGCSPNEVKEETIESTNSQPVEEVREEKAKVFIQEGPEEITIRSENRTISKLSLVVLAYDPEEDILLEEEILKERTDIPADERVTWEVIYSEGIPSMKLLWELESGETGEYVIAYDGKEGLKEEEVMVFPKEENESKVHTQ